MKENQTSIVYWGPNGAINFVPSVLKTFKEDVFFFTSHFLSKLVLMKKIKWLLGCLIKLPGVSLFDIILELLGGGGSPPPPRLHVDKPAAPS